jgi:hypothetical protein
MTLNEIIKKIDKNEPFAFTRWGDGEWYNVNKVKGKNCDGNTYYEDLGDELLKIVSEPQDYYLGVQTLIPYSVSQSKLYPQNWVDADVFHKASVDGVLDEFIDTLKSAHVVYIGNKSLKKLSFINEFIETPFNDSWKIKDQILMDVKITFSKNPKVYLFSSGMSTNYYIHKLWKLNCNNIYIDIGSLFDPYVGRITRSYHRNLKIKNI